MMKKTILTTIFYAAFAANIFAIELGEATRKTVLVEHGDLGSAAWSNSTDFATAAEGDLAVSAIQPENFLSLIHDFGVQAIRPDLNIITTNTAWYSDYATWDTWLTGRLYGTNIVDFSSAKTNSASYANVPCLVMDGIGDWLDVPALTNGATIISYSGTATLTATPSNRVDSTAGTVYDLLLSDGSFFPMEENSMVTCYDVRGSGTNVTIHADGSSITTVRGGTVDKVPWMATHGGTKTAVIQSSAHGLGDDAFRGATTVGDYAVFAPSNADYVLAYNPVSNTLVQSSAHGLGNVAFWGATTVGDYAVFSPYYADYVLAYNLFGSSIRGTFLQYPALVSGLDDAAGLGRKNIPNIAHNGGVYDLDVSSVTNAPITYAELITGVHPGIGIETNNYYQIKEIYHVQ
jgi:hypothetical protein